ncbi:hypothetical protein V9K67_03265 [Paraflavisolibacter sp. H34]|uniref:OB-fold protein n=1 Tax=Huijunlia imazamoxiresistens TaxID=3127457 RepID=UPI003019C817
MKRILTIIILVAVVAGGWYAYKKFTGKVKSLTEAPTDARLSAVELLAAFEKDSAAANRSYLGKVLEVTAPVKSVEQEEGSATVLLGADGALSSIRCSMDSAFVKEAAGLNPGGATTVKGVCTGYNPDEMGLGADVVLNRCVLIAPKK